MQAAAREVVEETGFTDVELGAVVWYREVMLEIASGELVLFKESYILARCAGGDPSREGWEALEHDLVDDIRWWSVEDMRQASGEVFYPEAFTELLVELSIDAPPSKPRVLSLVDLDRV